MHFFGKFLKIILRFVTSVIIFLLLVGLAKTKWDVNAYISFLNSNDRSVFHRSQPATWADPFRPAAQQMSGNIEDILDDDSIDAEFSDMDVYDPSFEEDLNSITDSSLSGEEEDFGFTTDGQASDTHQSASQSELLDLIKERELQNN